MILSNVIRKKKEEWLFSKKTLGETHPKTLKAHNEYNDALWGEKEYDELVPSLKEYYRLLCLVKGKTSSESVYKLNELGVALYKMGLYNESANMLEQAYILREYVYGPSHDLTLQVMKNLILALKADKQNLAYWKMSQKMYQICIKEKGEKADNTVFALQELIISCAVNSSFQSALDLERQYIEIKKRAGEGEENLLDDYEVLAMILNIMKCYYEESRVREKILCTRERLNGKNAELTLKALDEYAASLRNLSKSLRGTEENRKKAYTITNRLWQSLIELKGQADLESMKAMRETVECLESIQNYEEAIDLQKRLLQLYQSSGEKTKEIGNAIIYLMELYLKNGQTEYAMDTGRETLGFLLSEKPLKEEYILKIRGLMQRNKYKASK